MTRPGILMLLVAALLVAAGGNAQSTFLDNQKKYARVRSAIEEKNSIVTERLTKNGLNVSDLHILIVAYKNEGILELYAKSRAEKTCRPIQTYRIVAKSGTLGPKSKQGDFQVPEGFYRIDRFNPASQFYLSLGINYPNSADRRRSHAGKPGGDIFIHGASVTIGCLPITDDKIKELYLYAVYARNSGQTTIPVYIFPFVMNDANMSAFERRYAANPSLIAFWRNLKKGFDLFMAKKAPLAVTPDANGQYIYR
ncbi:MAG: L,D-transpeptidase family protein [Tannerella sp.]|jgi:murein L,D-transpeptidase YafK|nr:L,D-transpeptidase family protein [Tannerella sp.]